MSIREANATGNIVGCQAGGASNDDELKRRLMKSGVSDDDATLVQDNADEKGVFKIIAAYRVAESTKLGDALVRKIVAEVKEEILVRKLVVARLDEIIRKDKKSGRWIVYKKHSKKQGGKPTKVGNKSGYPSKLEALAAQKANDPPKDPKDRERLDKKIGAMKKNPLGRMSPKKKDKKETKKEGVDRLIEVKISDVPADVKRADQRLSELERSQDGAEKTSMETVLKVLERELKSKGLKYVASGTINKGKTTFRVSVGNVEVGPFTVVVKEDGPKIEVGPEAKESEGKIDPQKAAVIEGIIARVQAEMAKASPTVDASGAVQKYLDEIERKQDEYLSKLSTLERFVLNRVAEQKFAAKGESGKEQK